MKILLALVWLSATLGASPTVPTPVTSSGSATPATGYRWPLPPTPQVVRAFVPPPEPWAAGHRGVDLLAGPGVTVSAAGPGRVTHSGVIAGRGTVTLTHRDGRRTTYEPLAARLATGTEVAAGDRIGTLSGLGSHCPPRACLHWGLLVGVRDYRDPLTLLHPTRVRLLPVPD